MIFIVIGNLTKIIHFGKLGTRKLKDWVWRLGFGCGRRTVLPQVNISSFSQKMNISVNLNSQEFNIGFLRSFLNFQKLSLQVFSFRLAVMLLSFRKFHLCY